MRRNWDRLWAELYGGPDAPPGPRPSEIRRRVNAALDAVPSERRRHMRQKLRFAAVLAAVILALMGTALAVTAHLDVLAAWFEGDTSPAESLVDRTARSVSDNNYTFTVESPVSDGQTAFLLIRIDALNEASAAWLKSEDFNGIDTFSIYPLVHDPDTGSLAYGGGGGTAYSEGEELRTKTSCSWRIACDLPENQTAAAVHARMGYMEKGLALEVPLTPVESVTVPIGAEGQGVPSFLNPYPGSVTLEQVVISPFTIQMAITWTGDCAEPPSLPILFRMADGTLRSYAQMTETGGQSKALTQHAEEKHGSLYRRFQEIQNLSQLAGVVIWGVEYPLDGGAPRAVATDPHLLPFTLPLMPGLSAENSLSLPVRDLCDGLGASCVWDDSAGTATLQYHGSTVILTPGSRTALINGAEVELRVAPGIREGKLCVDSFLSQVWGFDIISPISSPGADGAYLFWLVTP